MHSTDIDKSQFVLQIWAHVTEAESADVTCEHADQNGENRLSYHICTGTDSDASGKGSIKDDFNIKLVV